MENLIRHLWLNHSDKIVEKSIFNCHTRGLHSIMLLESPEQTIRLYYSAADSEMCRNYPFSNKQSSIAAHPHHCDISIQVIKGPITNIIYERVQLFRSGLKPQVDLIPHEYISAITTSKGGAFKRTGAPVTFCYEPEELSTKDWLPMSADQIHSVACPYGTSTAWFIFEGKEDINYKPIAFARHCLDEEDFQGLYIKPTREQVRNILNELFDLYLDYGNP